MIVSRKVSPLWQHIPAHTQQRLEEILGRHATAKVFFRADDVAIPSANQKRLLELFAHRDAPLCAAIVPAWLNQPRWDAMCRQMEGKHHLFAWHQHGWNHHNHETLGKKQEFGPGTSVEQKHRNILRGRDKLARIIGTHFLPVFTPPWNRLDDDTLRILKDLGFRAISRYRDAKVPSIPGLPDLPANVDLHTRQEGNAKAGWDALFDELDQALATGLAGLMIHHQRMNGPAFAFLEMLLPEIASHKKIRLCHYGDLLDDHLLDRKLS
jgi:peptidoglycan/xylan/chitin deacetylase (PgdA/CDA1 family)